jgi:phospholipase C
LEWKNDLSIWRLFLPGSNYKTKAGNSMKKLKHGLRVVMTSGLVGLLAFSLPMPISAHDGATATPIEHLVVIFQENVSFRPLFRNLSERDELTWRAGFPRQA